MAIFISQLQEICVFTGNIFRLHMLNLLVHNVVRHSSNEKALETCLQMKE